MKIIHLQEDDELYKFQAQEWDPVIQWFCDRFQVNLQKSRSMEPPKVEESVKATLNRYLMSYNFAAINGKWNFLLRIKFSYFIEDFVVLYFFFIMTQWNEN